MVLYCVVGGANDWHGALEIYSVAIFTLYQISQRDSCFQIFFLLPFVNLPPRCSFIPAVDVQGQTLTEKVPLGL